MSAVNKQADWTERDAGNIGAAIFSFADAARSLGLLRGEPEIIYIADSKRHEYKWEVCNPPAQRQGTGWGKIYLGDADSAPIRNLGRGDENRAGMSKSERLEALLLQRRSQKLAVLSVRFDGRAMSISAEGEHETEFLEMFKKIHRKIHYNDVHLRLEN